MTVHKKVIYIYLQCMYASNKNLKSFDKFQFPYLWEEVGRQYQRVDRNGLC